MPRVIFKCPYLKGGAAQAAHLGNYVRYMATRKGAQRIAPDAAGLPATKKQREMVEQLIRDFPLSRGLFEYEDYLASPTRGNASEFITRALEDNYDSLAKKENYISYIASRPRAQRTGAHALFTGSDDPLTLSQIADEVAHHPGNVWLPIISLRREDAARLGYEDAARWRELLNSYAVEMAAAMKIPWEQFRWYAAFNDEAHHPHLHMVCYSADGKSGYLTKTGIAQIKSEIEHTDSDFDREKLKERLAKLSGGVAIIKVGAATEVELKEIKHRIEDALQATRAAVEEGIVAGGGVAFIEASSALDDVESVDADEKIGVEIIRKALEAPVRTIANNAGFEGSVVVEKIKGLEAGQGLNSANGEWGDMIEMGVLDPVKVSRVTLQNAASVASLILITEATVSDVPKNTSIEEAISQAAAQGGQGGMY